MTETRTRFARTTVRRCVEALGPAIERASCVEDMRLLARRRVPRAITDFVDGGADSEESVRRALRSYSRLEFHPSILTGTSGSDTSVKLFGRRHSLPVILGPTGLMRLSHRDAESAVMAAADGAGVPFTLSTMGSVSMEKLAAQGSRQRRWFQLYLTQDADLNDNLVRRADRLGYETLVVTVGTPVVGNRLRDRRHGLSIPPRLGARTILDVARHPRWASGVLRGGGLGFGNLVGPERRSHADIINGLFEPGIAWSDVATLRDRWRGPLVLKGVLSATDALRAKKMGADGIVLSSHGGRQLDRGPTPLEVLPSVRETVGQDFVVLVDSGVRSGADVAGAIALGASACMVARPYLYGLMTAGQAGVERVLDIFREELARTLLLLGVDSVRELGPRHASLRTGC